MSRRYDFNSRRAAASAAAALRSDDEILLVDETELDFPVEELREFLSADLFDVPADPTFKEGLREKLWELIQSGSIGGGRPRGH